MCNQRNKTELHFMDWKKEFQLFLLCSFQAIPINWAGSPTFLIVSGLFSEQKSIDSSYHLISLLQLRSLGNVRRKFMFKSSSVSYRTFFLWMLKTFWQFHWQLTSALYVVSIIKAVWSVTDYYNVELILRILKI